jgi:hypothetical protein
LARGIVCLGGAVVVVVGAGVAADPDGVEDAGFFAALLAAGVAPTPAGRSTKAWSPVDARLVASRPVRRILSAPFADLGKRADSYPDLRICCSLVVVGCRCLSLLLGLACQIRVTAGARHDPDLGVATVSPAAVAAGRVAIPFWAAA